MKISEFSVRRPVAIMVVFTLLILFGILAMSGLPMDIMPNVEMPTLSISTTYRGANPIDVEKKISEPLEKNLSTVNGLKDINSVSMEGLSTIRLSFDWGYDLNEAADDIRGRLDFANYYLPEDAEKPVLRKYNASMAPIMFIGIEVEPGVEFPQKYIERNVVDKLMKVRGVGAVNLSGFADEIVSIELSADKMEKYNLSLSDVHSLLSGYNASVPATGLDIGKRYVTVRTEGEFPSILELAEIPVQRSGGKTILLQDIAKVDFGKMRQVESKVMINGRPGGLIMIRKASDENTVTVAKRVAAALDSIKRSADKLKVFVLVDQAGNVEATLKNLGYTLIFCMVFVVLIVFLLLWDLRGALIIASSIPFSLIISFIFMRMFGYTINMISLGALAIAVGMVVDAAIVMFENIFRHRYILKEPLRESAMFAPGEVGIAVSASVMTTAAIFFPLTFVRGFVGVFFSQLGVIVTIVLFASLFTSLTVVPALSSLLLPSRKKKDERQEQITAFWQRFGKRTGAMVRSSFKHGGLLIAVLLLIFGVSLILFRYIPKEFIPEQDNGRIEITMDLPAFMNVNESESMARALEDLIKNNIPDEKVIFYTAGTSRRGTAINTNQFQLNVQLTTSSSKRRPIDTVANEIRKLITAKLMGYKNFSISTSSGFGARMMSSGGSGAELEIYGDDLEKMAEKAEYWKSELLKLDEVRNAVISFERGKMEARIIPDISRAAEFGLTPLQLGDTIRTVLYGAKVGEFRQSGEVFEIYLNYSKKGLEDLDSLRSLVISTPVGKKVRLENIAEIREFESPFDISRKNRQRIITVSAILKNSKFLGKVTDWLEKNSAQDRTPGITYGLGGTSKDMKDSFKSLYRILALAVLLVFLVMAAQFESLRGPFIIMFSVPFAVTGVFIGLFITGTPMSLNAMIGMIMLVGIVVNNAIVMVDYTNTLRKRGRETRDALEEAVSDRVKPILMTTLTTALGMLPLVLARGTGSETWRPLGVSVISGLLLSTVITVFLVPNVYLILQRHSEIKNKAIY